ncbi:MAG: CoA pyrophosphatase [Sphingomonadaceae bacterium]|nr:CoA pyrophosphatase [Sphingomonadaceae bacterium]
MPSTVPPNLRARLARAVAAEPGPPARRGDWDFAGNADAPYPQPLIPAAVLIAVVAHDRPTVLLTRRTAHLRAHAGQVAFPGGRIDATDADAVAAALREAHEEVALPPAAVDVVGTGDRYATGTGYDITPVIGIVPPGLPLVPAADEVASIFEVPLHHLLDPANHRLRSSDWQGRRRSYYVIAWETYEIWGATAAMIVNLARRLA